VPASPAAPEKSAPLAASLDRLASGLAHELRNPLSTLKLNLQLLAQDIGALAEAGTGTEHLTSRLGALQTEIRRLEDIISDVSRFARSGRIRPSKTNLNALISEVTQFMRPEAQRNGVALLTNLEPRLLDIVADPDLLKQSLLNLILNAIQAMPDGGHVMLATASVGTTHERLTITDTGAGIPPAQLEQVWEVYHTTKKSGTGLGLPTVRRIVEAHRGAVSLTSEVGKGTIVSI
jgi:signal transduction histidine kinase